MQLVSKIQYKNYETGEFSSIAFRTAEETLLLIDTFPWDEQRHLTDVQLTCPSVTIERGTSSFLKIGAYFNGKFCLYLYENGSLYQKPIPALPDGIETIKCYYYNKDIRTEFEKTSLSFNSKKHFATAHFEYRITGKQILSFLLFPEIIMTIPLSGLVLAAFLAKPDRPRAPALVLAAILFILFIGINLYLFLDYYLYSKNLYLRVSKGQDEFYFGGKKQYKEYSKKDINNIVVYKHRSQRVNWAYYAVFEITFKNGDQILFPSLLLRERLFDNKFANHGKIIKHKFLPTIPCR